MRKLRAERGRRPSAGAEPTSTPSSRRRRDRPGADPRPRRSSRRGQDVARRVGRPRPRALVRAGRPRRRPRRGRDPRPPAHLRRRPARPHRPGHDRGRHHEPGVPARRDRQGRQRLAGRPVRRRCSRCSTRRRTTRSATTTSRSTSTCPTCCSSPPPTCSTPSPARCSTAWRSSGSTATPTTRRSPSPATTCWPASSTATACGADEVDVTDDALRPQSSPTTPARPASRNLERQLGKVLRKAATRIASGDGRPVTVERRRPDSARLGRPAVHPRGEADRTAVAGRGHRPGRHRSRRRRAVRRGHARWTGEQGLTAHRPARRRDEGVGADRPVVRPVPRAARSASTPAPLRPARSTCTSRPGRCPRTGRRPASR